MKLILRIEAEAHITWMDAHSWFFRQMQGDELYPKMVYGMSLFFIVLSTGLCSFAEMMIMVFLFTEHYDNLITMRINHGGYFTKFPGRRYIKGKHNFVDLIDTEKFSIHELDAIMLELGYP